MIPIQSKFCLKIKKLIEQQEVILQRRIINQYILSKGQVSCQLNASSLFDWEDDREAGLPARVRDRLANLYILSKQMSYIVEVNMLFLYQISSLILQSRKK